MEAIGLYISVPAACFRVPRAREYFETFPCPPPSTVYGMVLSLVGEVNRRVHEGAEIAIAMLSQPDYSVVLRTMWRVKKTQYGPGLQENRRPDFQELLTDVRLAVWVRPGQHESTVTPLAARLDVALDHPSTVNRFGALSLGESAHLVNDVSRLKGERLEGKALLAEEDGDLSLPIWPDHVGSNTRWGQYRLVDSDIGGELPPTAWTAIMRPDWKKE